MTNTNKTKTGSQITNHCRECGTAVEEFCAEHPKSIVDSIVSNSPTYVIQRADFGYFLVDSIVSNAPNEVTQWSSNKDDAKTFSTEASADAYCIEHKLIAATVVAS